MALIDIYLSRILFKNNLFVNSTAYNIHVKLWPYSPKELRIFFSEGGTFKYNTCFTF